MNKLMISSLTFFGFLSCSTKESAVPQAPFSAQVVALVAPSNPALPAAFEIGPKTFATLQNLENLDGWFVQMHFGGSLKAKTILGSIVSDGFFSGGESPNLRYSVKNGVVVPADYLSLAMLSAYYQFDVVASGLSGIYGIQPGALAAAQREKKYSVLLEPSIELETAGVSGKISGKRNAAFVPGYGQFVLFERSRAEKVPLAANLQVIAHEFGHAIFDYTFFDNSFSSSSQYAGNFVIAGLNEGMADFTSFLYTGSADVLSGSLSGIAAVGERNFANPPFTISSVSSGCSGSFYCLGTLFASSMLQAYTDLAANTKVFSQSIPSRLRAARAALDASGQVISSDSGESGTLTVADYAVAKTFLRAFAQANQSLTPDITSKLCARFGETFAFSLDSDWSCQ